ncbi:hypothetical protein LCGC14_0929080 [marine sediment metagenome]|uniref:Uncharacterized protein n=1 Tax=marine sediment metagenome TaxID=412755 RepID=A0A0F9P9F3_9ZZZZ
MKTNILVQYQGGGYDGCIWEWNYFYIDKQGTFHDIQSSGCRGIDNLPDAIELIEQDESGTFVYDMSKDEDITAFCKESHPVHVLGVLRWFENDYNELGVQFFAVCSACGGQNSDADDMIVEGDILLDYECYSLGQCPSCEQYVGDDELEPVNRNEHHDFDYICSDCKEYHDEEREAESLEDLRW